MVTCTGKSLIPISLSVYQKFMNSVVPSDKLPEFTIKLDARSKVKSMFAKLVGNELTIYTGAIINLGSVKFPEVPDAESLLMLFTIFGVKKAGSGVEFELKANDAGIAEAKCDQDFKALSGQLHFFMDKFRPLNASAISTASMFEATETVQAPVQQVETQQVVVQEQVAGDASTEKPKKIGASPYKGVPLGDTPKISVPDDLDLRTV